MEASDVSYLNLYTVHVFNYVVVMPLPHIEGPLEWWMGEVRYVFPYNYSYSRWGVPEPDDPRYVRFMVVVNSDVPMKRAMVRPEWRASYEEMIFTGIVDNRYVYYLDVPRPPDPGFDVKSGTWYFLEDVNGEVYEYVRIEPLFHTSGERELIRLMVPNVIMSFDDSLLDQYTIAYPLMERYGFKGSMGLITGLMGGMWEGKPCITWEQARELLKSGWGIASHSHTHKFLRIDKGATAEDCEYECKTSKEMIEEKLGVTPITLLYPYGSISPEFIPIVAKYYRYGRTVEHRLDDMVTNRYQLGGVALSRENYVIRLAKVNHMYELDPKPYVGFVFHSIGEPGWFNHILDILRYSGCNVTPYEYIRVAPSWLPLSLMAIGFVTALTSIIVVRR